MSVDRAERAPLGRRLSRPAHAQDLMVAVPAVPAALRGVRVRVREWLDTMLWPVPGAEDIELAVSEAVSNVVEHAYPPDAPGSATLHAWVSLHPRTGVRCVVAAVTDRGRWAGYHPDTYPAAARGHGLVVMSGAMAQLHIQRAAAGTTVIMISFAIPPARPLCDGERECC